MPHKFVALDIGGVCLQIFREKFFPRRLLETPPAALIELETAFECGRISAAEWLPRIRELMPALQQLPAPECWRRFRSIVGPEVPGIAALTSRWVSQGLRVIFFSNTSCVHADEVWRNISFGGQIADAVYSYEAGFMKPAPEIYRCFEQRFGVPELYLDDNAENILAARQLGWENARLFTGTSALLQEN